MPLLVDTNVILDIVTGDSDWADWSANILSGQEVDDLFVNPVIFSELCVGANTPDEVIELLEELGITVHDLTFNALFLAAKAFRKYRLNEGNKISPLPDFYIGAQAADEGCTILTRDPARYRTYFPEVELISP